VIGRVDISNEELHAFIDGELDETRSAEIAELVTHDADLARQIAAFRADKARLLRLFGPVIDRPLPAHWRTRILRPAPRYRIPAFAAVAASLVLVVGLLVLRQSSGTKEDTIIAEAIAARGGSALAERSIAIASSREAASSSRLMSETLRMKARAPELTQLGYKLTAMEIYPGVPGGKAIELVYRGHGDRQVTLYVRHAAGAPRFDQFERNGMRVCIWQDDVVGMVVTGSMSAAEMQRLASLAYSALQA
jgi:anti-sigma factor RsiW